MCSIVIVGKCVRMCSDDYGTVKPCIEGPPLLIVSVNTCTIDFDLCKETIYLLPPFCGQEMIAIDKLHY